MNTVIMVGQFLLGISILVILHELGHFLAAKAFGIKVEKFYLFFDAWGFSLIKFNYKDVEYGIGWLPLGGYVKISGMIDESMDTEQLAGPPQPWEFRSKPAWQRLIVMMAGIIVNVLLAIFIYWMLTARLGESYIPNSSVKYGIVPGAVGKKMGLEAGDKITAINGKPVDRFEDIVSAKVLLDHTVLTVQRDSQTLNFTVPLTIINDISEYGNSGLEAFIGSEPRTTFVIDSILPKGRAQQAGLLKGDSVIAVNNAGIRFFDEFQSKLLQNANKPVNLTIRRNHATIGLIANITAQGTINAMIKPDLPKEKTIKYGFFGSLPIGADKAWGTFVNNIKGFGKIFKGEAKISNMSGPVRMATMFGSTIVGSTIDWSRFWALVGFLSLALAFTNLIPIPALDGGHAIFLIIEMVKGKPLSDKFLERAQIVGFVLLISLMVFVFGNDILRLLKNRP
jgi:regulator of sigma E protease